jgi:integrase
MVMVYQTVGNTIAQWQESSPLTWSMQETIGKGDDQQINTIELDIRSLADGYEMTFLLALKDALTDRRHRVSLRSIENETQAIKSLLKLSHQKGIMIGKVAQIDSTFLLGLHECSDSITAENLDRFKRLFKTNRTNTKLFDGTLYPEDFPVKTSKRGQKGDRINNILSNALTRSAMVSVLDIVEEAYEAERIDIGQYSFAKLAFNIFCRPSSYRQLRVKDLELDTNKETGEISYFLYVLPAKSRVKNPKRIQFRLHRDVGQILALQRQSVVETYGHKVQKCDMVKLALFPARMVKSDGTWTSAYANSNYGMSSGSTAFTSAYLTPIKQLASRAMSFNGLRHTIGTQLAQMKCSAQTIAAVLKHADDTTCQTYVDIVFDGLIDELSDALQPGFEEHFPVFKGVFKGFCSKNNEIPRERAIVSEDLSTGRTETIAACGRNVICQYAPLACYPCPRFIPCWDADHSINLDIVEREIHQFEGQGLAMQHEVKKYKHLRNGIRVVMIACDVKRKELEMESASRAYDRY